MVIGALWGIRAAEIERLEWSETLRDRGCIEIKAAKAALLAQFALPANIPDAVLRRAELQST